MKSNFFIVLIQPAQINMSRGGRKGRGLTIRIAEGESLQADKIAKKMGKKSKNHPSFP
jgi:hypothetical protein